MTEQRPDDAPGKWLHGLPAVPPDFEVVRTPGLVLVRFPTTGPRARVGPMLLAGLTTLILAVPVFGCLLPRAFEVAFVLSVAASVVVTTWTWHRMARQWTLLTVRPDELEVVAYGTRRSMKWDDVYVVRDQPFVPSRDEHESEIQSHVRLEVRPGMFGHAGPTVILGEGLDDRQRAYLFAVLTEARSYARRPPAFS